MGSGRTSYRKSAEQRRRAATYGGCVLMGQCRTAPPSHRPGEKSLPPSALGARTAARPLRGTQAAAPPTPAFRAEFGPGCRRGSEPVVWASMTQDARSFLVARGCARHSAFLYCILILIVRNPSACLLDVWHGGFLPRAWRVMLFRCCGWRATCGRASALRRSSPARVLKKKKSSADFAGCCFDVCTGA